MTSPAPVAAPSVAPATEVQVSAAASSHTYTAAQDDATLPPPGGWHRLIWSLILLIGLVSAAGTGLLVYFLARQTF